MRGREICDLLSIAQRANAAAAERGDELPFRSDEGAERLTFACRDNQHAPRAES
jgi:hypothetical protein